MKKILFLILFSNIVVLNVKSQLIADTFCNQSNFNPSNHIMNYVGNYKKEWVKYRPNELFLRGIVPGTIIYGVSYYKALSGYYLPSTIANLEVKYRSGSMDSTVPSYNGSGSTCDFIANYLMTGGFASWTTFYYGNNLFFPASPGWIPPLIADVPFVYTGGALEICTTWQLSSINTNIGQFAIAQEITGQPFNAPLSYIYVGALGASTTTRASTIIYHSGAPSTCSGMPVCGHVTGLNNVCKNQDFTLYLYNPSAGPGISYQWQKSSVNPIAWTNIVGATAPSVNTSTATPQLYRCKVTCSNSGLTAISDSFAITPHFYQIDSIVTPIAGNMLTILQYDNDTTFPVLHSYLTSNWDTLICDTPPCNTPPFTKHFTTDGTYNLVYVCGNTCNLDTAYSTITIGCAGSATFHDTIASSLKTCPGNPVTLNLLDTLPANYTIEWQAYLNFQWTILSGLTTPSVTVNPTTNTIYRNKSTCNISTNFKYSNYDTVWVTPPPIAGTIQALNTTTNYYNFTNTGMSNAQSYKWYFGDGDSSTSLAPSHHYNIQGTYNVWFVVTNAGNGCTDTAFTTVTITTGVEDVQGKLFSVSPNPFKEGFTVSCPSGKGTITILNSVGQLMIMKPISSSDHCQLSTENWSSGVYLIRYKDNEGRTETRKITKQ